MQAHNLTRHHLPRSLILAVAALAAAPFAGPAAAAYVAADGTTPVEEGDFQGAPGLQVNPTFCGAFTIKVCLTIGDVVDTIAIGDPNNLQGPTIDIIVSLDRYQIGSGPIVACLTIIQRDEHDNVVHEVNPCKTASFAYHSNIASGALLDEETPPGAPIVTVRICSATLSTTVEGVGINNAPIQVAC